MRIFDELTEETIRRRRVEAALRLPGTEPPGREVVESVMEAEREELAALVGRSTAELEREAHNTKRA